MTINVRIVKTPGVCGGAACIRGTRISVWELVESRNQGMTDERLIDIHPALTPDDLKAAWAYAQGNSQEIERELWENEASMIEHDGRNISARFLRRGREIGLTDSEIRDAFEPPLDQSILDAIGNSIRDAVET